MKGLPSVRLMNGIGFVICTALLASALYLQWAQHLEPCPLCILQRIAFVMLAVLFLMGVFLKHKIGLFIQQALVLLASGTGITIAARQVWLQHLPPDQVPACGPSFDYIVHTFPLSKAIQLLFQGSADCAVVQWQWLGLTMPEWSLGFFVLLALLALSSLFRIK